MVRALESPAPEGRVRVRATAGVQVMAQGCSRSDQWGQAMAMEQPCQRSRTRHLPGQGPG
jgi:hypothetical protein